MAPRLTFCIFSAASEINTLFNLLTLQVVRENIKLYCNLELIIIIIPFSNKTPLLADHMIKKEDYGSQIDNFQIEPVPSFFSWY